MINKGFGENEKKIKVSKFVLNQYEKKALRLLQKGDLKKAEEIYNLFLRENIFSESLINNLSEIYFITNEKNKLINCLKKGTSFYKDSVPLLYKLAKAYRKYNFEKDAIEIYEIILKKSPKDVNLICNMAQIYKDQKNFDMAIKFLKSALEIKPNTIEIMSNLAFTYNDIGKLKKAISIYKKALNLQPLNAILWLNLGISLQGDCEINLAINAFRKAHEINPNLLSAKRNLALALLQNGNYEEGWKYFEMRDLPLHSNPGNLKKWQGDLDTKENLLIITEQGYGDTIQFMRYLPYIRKLGIDITFFAQEKLHSLIKSSNIHSMPLKPSQIKEFKKGVWIPLLSIPRILNISPENNFCNEKYIKVKEVYVKKWEKIIKKNKPTIGINWQGDITHENFFSRRGIPLEDFSILLKENDITFLSLQKGYGSEEFENCSFKSNFVTSQGLINKTWSFQETAAIIECCDLIITNDTAVAHLAGAMGKPVWLLLRKIPEWRWGLNGEKTFWYKSLRLFRQNYLNDWKELLSRVSIELKLYLKNY